MAAAPDVAIVVSGAKWNSARDSNVVSLAMSTTAPFLGCRASAGKACSKNVVVGDRALVRATSRATRLPLIDASAPPSVHVKE